MRLPERSDCASFLASLGQKSCLWYIGVPLSRKLALCRSLPRDSSSSICSRDSGLGEYLKGVRVPSLSDPVGGSFPRSWQSPALWRLPVSLVFYNTSPVLSTILSAVTAAFGVGGFPLWWICTSWVWGCEKERPLPPLRRYLPCQ